MKYSMQAPKDGDHFAHMEKDILFNRWWSLVSGDNQMPSTKKIAYGAWQAGIRHFIEAQKPLAYWESSIRQTDHVTFDAELADRWKTQYNMAVEPLYTLPSTDIVDKRVSKECVDD
jgi:hypothetical protein